MPGSSRMPTGTAQSPRTGPTKPPARTSERVMTRTSQTPPLDSSPPGTGPGINIDSDSPASAIGPASRRWSVHARGPTRTTRLQPRPCHGPRAPRDLAPAKHTEPRRVEHSPPFAATRHGQQARILLRQPGDGVKDCRTLAPLPRSARPSTLHVYCRRSSSARPKDHGSLWYPTHSTASESLQRALSRPTLRGVPRNLAGRTSPDYLARPGTSLLPTRIHCQGRTARQPVPSNSAPWMLQKPGRSGDSDTS